jgi:hypothetical protein
MPCVSDLNGGGRPNFLKLNLQHGDSGYHYNAENSLKIL